jgi:hypothetical protein
MNGQILTANPTRVAFMADVDMKIAVWKAKKALTGTALQREIPDSF